MPSKNERMRRNAALRSAAVRAVPEDDETVIEARRILAELAAVDDDYVFEYYRVDPQWLTPDLDVPNDGRIHTHGDDPRGRVIHLDQVDWRATMTEASNGFTGPFVAVPRRPELAGIAVDHAVIATGANFRSEMLLGPLQVIQRARRLAQLHFAALLGYSGVDGDWTPRDEADSDAFIEHFQLRVEAEAVLAAAPYFSIVGY